MTARDSVQEAIFNLDGAITILATAAASGLAAGPATATAAGPFTVAGDRFQDALSQPTPETPASVQVQLRDLRDASYARAREAVAVSFVPWPIIFVPLGGLLAAAKTMRDSAQETLNGVAQGRFAADASEQMRLDSPNPFLGPLGQ